MAHIKKEKIVRNTHGGGKAAKISPEAELERSVLACLLWEKEFYEDGVSIAKRIYELALSDDTRPSFVSELAIRARKEHGLRHVPLVLLTALAKKPTESNLVSETINATISRADEITEFLAVYFELQGKDAKISKQVRLGLKNAFANFDEYQFAKYNRKNRPWTFKDVMCMVHPIPKTTEKATLYNKIYNGELTTPNTWETRLSEIGQNKDQMTEKDIINAKRAVFEDLLRNDKLGYMALLRNLRNMEQLNVEPKLIEDAIVKTDRAKGILPFQFMNAAKNCNRYRYMVELALLEVLSTEEKIPGKTVIIVDTSGSMSARVSDKSISTRMDIAGLFAAIGSIIFEDCVVYSTAGDDWSRKHATMKIDSINSQDSICERVKKITNVTKEIGWGGIFMRQVMDYINDHEDDIHRVICITDEQDCSGYDDSPSKAKILGKYNYLWNIGSYKHTINFGKWINMTSISDSAFKFMEAYESNF